MAKGESFSAPSELGGPSVAKILLSPANVKRYEDATESVTLPFKHADLVNNADHVGGFIPLILAALGSSVIGGLIEKGIAGSGIHKYIWNHGKGVYHMVPQDTGIHLYPYKGKRRFTHGRGLYLSPYQGHGIRPAQSHDIKHLPTHTRKLIKTLIHDSM